MLKYNINNLPSWVHCFCEKNEAFKSFVNYPLKWGCWHYSDRLYAWDTIKLGLLYTRGWRATVWATWQPDSWLSPHQGDRLQHRPESKLKWIRENIQSRYETIGLTNMSCANLHKNLLTRVTVECQERSDKRNYWWPKFGLANLTSVGLGFESNHND